MSSGGKFGTLGGVFTPSILTILGVIMYMRLGWIVGNAGSLAIIIGIIITAHVVSITTGLSVSSIATDKKIKAGGIYYMLSRSLGFPIGGAIGVTIFVATALSISLYLIGFAESSLPVFGLEVDINNLRLMGTFALIAIVSIAYISTSIAIKSQYVILGLIILSLISVFFGTTDGKGFDFSEISESTDKVDFSVLFGIFFPAVTGFTAGVAMSGDLKDPKKSIPWGTMLAIGTGLIVYIVLGTFIYFNIPFSELQNNNNALVEYGWNGVYLVTAGVWGATLSSALGGILGAPRILQAMSIDNITPRFFARGVGESNEPRRALLFTFLLAEIGILIGELDVIAGVVAMFYMAAYLFINVSCFLEQWASPDFRPTFRISNYISFFGAIATAILMIKLNAVAAIVSVIIMGLVFLWLTRKQLELGSGDVWQSVWSSIVKLGLKNLNKKSTHDRNWEPNILLFSGGNKSRPHLLEFSKSIAGRNGMISNFDLVENKSAEVLFPKHKQSQIQDDLNDDSIFNRKQECKDIYSGIEAIAGTYGFSGVEPNTVLMGWAKNSKEPARFTKLTNTLHQLDYNVLFLDYDAGKGFGDKQRIDIWWKDLNQLSFLTVQLTKLLMTSKDWLNAEVRFFFLNGDNSLKYSIKKAIEKRTEDLRSQVSIEVINNEIEQKDFYEIVKEHSLASDLIVIDLPELNDSNQDSFVKRTNDLLGILGTTLIVKASSHFQDGLGINSTIEKGFNTLSKNKLEVQIEQQLPVLGSISSKEISALVKDFDQEVLALNEQFVNGVYNPLNKVYEVLLAVLEKEDDLEKESLLNKIEELLIDIQENRFQNVGVGIALGIKTQLQSLKDLINALPFQVLRHYEEHELRINNSDSHKLKKQKKKLTRWSKNPKTKVRVQAIAEHHYESNYLVAFKKRLNTIGISTLQLNNVIKKWLCKWVELEGKEEKRNAIKELSLLLSEHLLLSKQRTFNELNRLSRKYSNSILFDSNQLEIKDIVVLREEERSSSALKAIYNAISNYPLTWQTNADYLTNQLCVNIWLLKIKDSSIPKLESILEEVKKKEIKPIIAVAKEVIEAVDSLEISTLIKLENQLLELGIEFNANSFVDELIKDFEVNITEYCKETEVLTQFVLNEFDVNQDGLIPDQINVPRVVAYLVDNEIITEVNNLIQFIANEVKSEALKMENSLRLLQFTMTNQKDDNELLIRVKDKVQTELTDAITHLESLNLKLSDGIKGIVIHIKKVLVAETVLGKAENLNGVIRKEKAKKGYYKHIRKLKYWVEKTNNGIDRLVIKGKDLLAISSHEYRTKELKNPHSIMSSFVDSVSISKEVNDQLPFYYHQLFIGKYNAPNTPLKNRASELALFDKAYTNYKNGKKGAILFTGEQYAGVSYLIGNVLNSYQFDSVLRLEKPTLLFGDAERLVERAFKTVTGLNLGVEEIIKRLPNNTVVVIEDLELWWTRTENGIKALAYLNRLIKKYNNKVLFLLSCNSHCYQFVRQLIEIDANLLETITLQPLKIQDIKRAVFSLHRSGGLRFEWKGKHEKELSNRKENQLIKRIASVSKGNIGTTFYTWLGNIEKVENNIISFSKIETQELPSVLSSELDSVLLQILLHRELSLSRLMLIYKNESREDLLYSVESLFRMGLIVEFGVKNYKLNPYVYVFVTDYLRKKELIS